MEEADATATLHSRHQYFTAEKNELEASMCQVEPLFLFTRG